MLDRPRAGFARRAEQFENLVRKTRQARCNGVTTARVVSLVSAAGRIVSPDVSPAAELCVPERQISRLLRELEDCGWIIRRYNRANRRSCMAGLDLRPVAARVEALRQAVAAMKASLASRYGEAEETADGLDYPQTPLSPQPGQSVTLKYLTKKSKEDSVQAEQGQTDDGQELVSLMVQASPTLQRVLSPVDQIALSSSDTASAGLARKKWRANRALCGQLESGALELDGAHIA